MRKQKVNSLLKLKLKLEQGINEPSHIDTLNSELETRKSNYWTWNSYLTAELTEGLICIIWKRQVSNCTFLKLGGKVHIGYTLGGKVQFSLILMNCL